MIIPEGSPLTFTSATPSPAVIANVAVNRMVFSRQTIPFKRMEFSHERLAGAKNADGSKPSVYFASGNVPVQFFTGCNDNETERDYTPDDTDEDNIYQRRDVIRYEITGAISISTEVNKLDQICQAHKVLIARFNDHIEKAASADFSYLKLKEMQDEDFSYLTTTGVTVSGFSLDNRNPETQVLLVEVTPEVEQEMPLDYPQTMSEVLKSWTMVFEKWVIVPGRSTDW